jgi:hypothetical protein
MKKKKASARGKKSKLKDLAPKADPTAGVGDVNGDRLQIGNTGNTGIGLLLPAVQKIYSK